MTLSSPLINRTVLVTRAANQQGEARILLEAEGARVLDLPALIIGPPDDWGPLDDALDELEDFHWLVFSSTNGVQAMEQRLKLRGSCLARRPQSLKIAAVGSKTAALLDELGAAADFVPPRFVADSLIENFPVSGFGLRMLLPRVQSGGRTLLADVFAEAGVRVVEVAAYESRCPDTIPVQTAEAIAGDEVDAICFSSGKTVSHSARLLRQRFGDQWGECLKTVKLISIGPQTSLSCHQHFGRVDAEADPHDLNGLVYACRNAFS